MRTAIYVDGFNLYYGALKNTPYKWLNIENLCSFILKIPLKDIVKICYFTAPVKARPQDVELPIRQETYLRALRTNPKTEIHKGQFLSHPVLMPPCNEMGKIIDNPVYVLKTEEKGSDVNLASYLLLDAFNNLYDQAIIISNDSDFVTPIQILRRDFNKRVGILTPHKKTKSYELTKSADFSLDIRRSVLKAAQFPFTLTDTKGLFTCPLKWRETHAR